MRNSNATERRQRAEERSFYRLQEEEKNFKRGKKENRLDHDRMERCGWRLSCLTNRLVGSLHLF